MEGAQVFTCKSGGNLRSILSRNNDAAMFLKVENNKISGKGYICNTEGKNGYSDEFEVGIGKISSIFETEYSGEPALAINTSLDNLYGSKKVQLVFPQLKDMDLAAKLLKKLRADGGFVDEAPKVAAYNARVGDLAQTAKPEEQPEGEKPQAKSVAELRSANVPPKEQPKPVQPAKPAQPVQPAQPVAPVQPAQPVAPAQPQPAVAPAQPAQPAAPAQPAKPAAPKGKMSVEEYNERVDKLNVLRDCGVLGEKEYYTKKFEIVCEYNDLTDFNEKIQKLIVLVDCGLLSEKEFENNCNDIIKECCDTNVTNPAEYRKNIQKLVCMEAGGILTTEEYNKYKQIMVNDVAITLDDAPAVFIAKLNKLPILVECQMITEAEQKQMMNNLYSMIEVKPGQPLTGMTDRMNKWPLLAQEHIISEADLRKKQGPVIDAVMMKAINGPADVQDIGENLMALRDGGWLTNAEFDAKKKDLLSKVDSIPDFVTRISVYVALPKMGLETMQEYEAQKKKCIDDIFAPYSGMDEFKKRVTNLMDLQKAGMLTEAEFNTHKGKLMGAL
ncbi:MAG: hypothetical protein E7295_10935 [Lachnospiraceae bacterium]|jgi:hypothetical protein|nr:hypothetical protein [Lachnospiraceae bacterium]